MVTSKPLIEIDGAELCPCESGRRYAKCCRKRGIKWTVDLKGEVYLERSLGSEAVSHIRGMEEKFVETFGRRPGASDRMLQLSEGYMRRATLRAMRKANIRPPLIYGYVKTGLIVADRKRLTGRDQQLWDAAIDEYYEAVEKFGEFEPDQEGAMEDGLIEQLRQSHTIGGSFIDRHFNKYRQRKGASSDVETVAGFLTSNFVRGILSVIVLTEGKAAYDAYNILRSMYEDYLILAFIYDSPPRVAAFTAQLGLLLGTHVYAINKKGVEVQSDLIELETGRRTTVPSRWEMAKTLGTNQEALYQTLYRDLSSICHSDLTGLQTIIAEGGYDYLNPVASINVLSLAHFLCLLMFSLLSSSSPCVKVLKRDLRVGVGRSFFELTLLRKVIAPRHGGIFPEYYATFLDELAARDPELRLLAESIEEVLVTPADAPA